LPRKLIKSSIPKEESEESSDLFSNLRVPACSHSLHSECWWSLYLNWR